MQQSQLLKGVLEGAVLALLADADSYGYDVARTLRTGPLAKVAGASVYRALRKLEDEGALSSSVVASRCGPPRRSYRITPVGRERLAAERGAWRAFARSIDKLLASAGPAP